MNEVAVGHQGTLKFRVEGTLRSPDGTTDNLTVTAELQGLRASKNIYDSTAGRRCCPFLRSRTQLARLGREQEL